MATEQDAEIERLRARVAELESALIAALGGTADAMSDHAVLRESWACGTWASVFAWLTRDVARITQLAAQLAHARAWAKRWKALTKLHRRHVVALQLAPKEPTP